MIAQPMLEQEVFAENMDPRKGGLRYGIRRREAMSVNYYVGVYLYRGCHFDLFYENAYDMAKR